MIKIVRKNSYTIMSGLRKIVVSPLVIKKPVEIKETKCGLMENRIIRTLS